MDLTESSPRIFPSIVARRRLVDSILLLSTIFERKALECCGSFFPSLDADCASRCRWSVSQTTLADGCLHDHRTRLCQPQRAMEHPPLQYLTRTRTIGDLPRECHGCIGILPHLILVRSDRIQDADIAAVSVDEEISQNGSITKGNIGRQLQPSGSYCE